MDGEGEKEMKKHWIGKGMLKIDDPEGIEHYVLVGIHKVGENLAEVDMSALDRARPLWIDRTPYEVRGKRK